MFGVEGSPKQRHNNKNSAILAAQVGTTTGGFDQRNWASAGWELHKPQWTEENCHTRHRGPVIHRPPSFRPRHRRRHICHIKLCMGKWFLEKLGVPHFWPKDGRHQMGDTGVTDRNPKLSIRDWRVHKPRVEGVVVFSPRGGRSPRLFQFWSKRRCGPTAAR